MTEKNYFKIAARKKMRFASTRGALTAEQLYELNLSDLDWVARGINSDLKALSEDSFVELKPDPRRGEVTDALELVKEIIADKLADKARAEKRQQKAALRRSLSEALARKKDEALSQASIEELQKQLAELDADED